MINESKFIVDIMTPNPVLVGPDASAWSAECLAQKRSVHDLLVMNDYHLAGVVCRCDLLKVGATARVSDCMRQNPVTIEDQETAVAAERLMDRCAIGCLPVLDWSGNLKGVVTRRDLVSAGVMPATQVRTCSACGSMHGLWFEGEGNEPVFCLQCLEQARQPRSSIDEQYFVVGGGD